MLDCKFEKHNQVQNEKQTIICSTHIYKAQKKGEFFENYWPKQK